MNDPDNDTSLHQMMCASAAHLGLTLPENSHAGILRDMMAILDQARICEDSLSEDTEPTEIAPVFQP